MSAEETQGNGQPVVTVTSPTKEFNLVDEYYPVGIPLSAKYKQGFGFTTINHRLPVILTKVIDQLSRDKNEIGDELGQEARDDIKTIVGALAKLKNEMVTNKPITPIKDPVWDNYLQHVAKQYFEGNIEDVTWYTGAWLHVECYFYTRIDLSFKLSSKHFNKNYDPFRKQKEEGMISSLNTTALLGDFVNESSDSSDEVLQTLLEVGLWGNRCDLSISVGNDVSQQGNLVEQLQDLRKFVLCDDSSNLWRILKQAKAEGKGPITIGYVLDNSGFELFTDFCLADKLIGMGIVDRVDFYVKTTPWFISDVMTTDFHWVLDKLASSIEYPALVQLGEKWKGFVSSNKWTVVESKFWTYPHAFFEMKDADPQLYSRLSQHTHLIFKGDLNYRKLIGDRSWPPETPFKEALQGFCPAPLLALRTLKADCVAGLKKGLAEELSVEGRKWLVTGDYGILQHAQ